MYTLCLEMHSRNISQSYDDNAQLHVLLIFYFWAHIYLFLKNSY